MPQIGKPDVAGMTAVAFVAGLLALLVAAGCGDGSTSANGDGNGQVAASVSGTIAVGTRPIAIAVDSTANKIYVTDSGTPPTGVPCSQSGADVEAIDGATQSTTSVDFWPNVQVIATGGAALNPVSHQLYVQVRGYWNGTKRNDLCGPFLASVEVFDTTPLQPPNGEAVAGFGSGIDVNPTTGAIYVTRDAVDVRDSNWNLVATIPVGSAPVGVAVNATSNKIYVANSGSNDVSVIDSASNSVVATITDQMQCHPLLSR